jgi:Na+-translocating ferredoxin:NAD+ oxidoreductase RnfC subunit
MAEEHKHDKTGRKRSDKDQPMVLPGIHRYQFFTNLKDRGWTLNLDRVALFGIVTALLATVVKPLARGNPATIYCDECRACYATQDRCPVGIAFQAELAVAGRVSDYDRFIRNGGLKCIRCGNCQSYCVQYLPLPQMIGTMQEDTREALRKGIVPRYSLERALSEGLVGKEFIDDVVKALA